MAAAGKSVLVGVAVDALAARAVQECRTQSSLLWFEPVATTPGFFRALAATLTELRLNNIPIESLRHVRPSGSDLAQLSFSYEQYLAQAGLADSAEIYQTAASAVNEGNYRFQGFPLLLLDVAPRSNLERTFIAALIAGAGSILAVINSRDESTVAFFETTTRTSAEHLGNAGASALDRLRQHVFSMTVPPRDEVDSTLEFRSATDEARECVEIARSILGAADAAVPFDNIAILLRNPDTYQPLVED